ncbi:hypothetical protein [Lysinibacillus fusiformis]|uniref:hypothetical protein n=1 Tax=Lysinibacillus fusiformis TaxID=28031 RepID=UPI002E1FB34D|nr:hypothetical protein [Lysinibacillus fusiformis]
MAIQENDLSQLVLEKTGLNKKVLLDRYDRLAQDTFRKRTLYWDIDDLVRETRYSKASLEKYIICDPRMKENCDKKLLEKCRATKGQGRKREKQATAI